MSVKKQGWEPWPRDVGLGFSFKGGGLLADMQPEYGDVLVVWRATVWAEGSSKADPLFTVVEDTHWECAAATKQRINEWKG